MKQKRSRSTLEKSRLTFLLIGLCLTLLAVNGLMNLKSYPKSITIGCPSSPLLDQTEINTPNTYRERLKKKEVVKNVEKIEKKLFSDYFIEVSNDLKNIDEDTSLYILDDDFDIYEKPDDMVIDLPALDKKPIFPGCENLINEQERFECFQIKMLSFVVNNFEHCYPDFGTIKEKVYVKFIINEHGEIKNAQIVKGMDDCNKEKALNVVGKLPKMMPGMYRGKQVKTSFVLPINIK